jgi:hypothetical protein
MNRSVVAMISLLFVAFSCCAAQTPQTSAPASGMSGHDMSNMNMSDSNSSDEGAAHAMHSMEGQHMDMGPHMKMTTLRELKPGDKERADAVVKAARSAAEKYIDYKVALADGYQIFMPNVPQKMYHFTNYRYAFEAGMHFNAEHPTSLLYEKHGDDYKLIGVMYTAPKRFSEAQLDERIPLSIAEWHAHVNLCLPPAGVRQAAYGSQPKFGLAGSIATEQDCDAAGGRFLPQVFGWMVHVYPFEKTQDDIWSVGRQMHNHMD